MHESRAAKSSPASCPADALRLQRGQGDPGADVDLPDALIDLPERVEPAERQDDLTVARHRATDEPCVAALGHDRGAGPSAGADHGGTSAVLAGPHDGGGAREAAGLVALVAGPDLGVAEYVARADGVDEGRELRHCG